MPCLRKSRVINKKVHKIVKCSRRNKPAISWRTSNIKKRGKRHCVICNGEGMDSKNILVWLDILLWFFFYFHFLYSFKIFMLCTHSGQDKYKKRKLPHTEHFCQNKYVTKGVLEDTKHWAWRVQTEELPQRELNLVYKYVQGNLVTKGRTSFITSEDGRTQNNGWQVEKNRKKFCWLF